MNYSEWEKLDRLLHSPSVMAHYELRQKKRKEEIEQAWKKMTSDLKAHEVKRLENNRK